MTLLEHRHLVADGEVKRFLATGLAIHKLQGELVKALFDRKAVLVAGSASPNPWLFPGRALVDELSLWTRAGIPASAALRAATSASARALGIEEESQGSDDS